MIEESFIVFAAILFSHLSWPPKARGCGSDKPAMKEFVERWS
jgi:hypothetical protein